MKSYRWKSIASVASAIAWVIAVKLPAADSASNSSPDQPAAVETVFTNASRIGFDDIATNSLPAGWLATQTGAGKPDWRVVRDTSAPSSPNALKQSGVADFPLCILTNSSVRDGFVETHFKPLAGEEDQAGGVVWRWRDANNYYVCRANALENNVVLYKVENGKRSSLNTVGRASGYGVKAPVARAQWQRLRVEFSGNRHRVFFNGQHLFDVEDRTFSVAGCVGLWTKADSVTLFDDFYFGSSVR